MEPSTNKVFDCHDCKDCFHKAPYFQCLSNSELDIINKDRYSVRYREGEMILKQGTSATHVLSLVGGIIKIYLEGIGDRNLLLNLLEPWALIGGPGVHGNNKIHYSVSALTDVNMCFIDAANFKMVTEKNAVFANQLINHMSERAVNMFGKIMSLTQKQMHGRMADGLLYLSRGFYKSDSFCMHLSRQDIADMTAMSKDSAIRILKEFERDGVIYIKGRELKILNMPQLLEISQKG
jgi:CRP/FNR family transcriptional regulator, polysaccharide utilization system transcription regulator